ncbi:MAG: hypothetical protein ACTFAL_06270 [Candidatus Electronema sp. V4]|uniref:hypothetical protein n=1 Tax=Candidatus Electronema sp. V4 TaxID=3454756 RepID=UPI004055401A
MPVSFKKPVALHSACWQVPLQQLGVLPEQFAFDVQAEGQTVVVWQVLPLQQLVQEALLSMQVVPQQVVQVVHGLVQDGSQGLQLLQLPQSGIVLHSLLQQVVQDALPSMQVVPQQVMQVVHGLVQDGSQGLQLLQRGAAFPARMGGKSSTSLAELADGAVATAAVDMLNSRNNFFIVNPP